MSYCLKPKTIFDLAKPDDCKKETHTCKICGIQSQDMSEIRYNDDNGFMMMGNCIFHICDECADKNVYINEYDCVFVKVNKDELYVKHNPFENYEKVRSNHQIEKAFNPDRMRFNAWLKE